MNQQQTLTRPPALRTGKSWWQRISLIFGTLGAGASTVPFGDNGDVFRALADARAKAHAEAVRSHCET